MSGEDHGMRGGHLWEQPAFPCMSRYVTLLDDDKWAMLSDPRQAGSMACHQMDGKWCYAGEELAYHLKVFGYVDRGPLANVIRDGDEAFYQQQKTDNFRAGVEAAASAECPYCRDGWPRFTLLLNNIPQHTVTHGDTNSTAGSYTVLCMAPWRDTLTPDSQP